MFKTDTTWPTYSADVSGTYTRELNYTWNSLGQPLSVTYPGGLIWNSQSSSYDNVASGKTYSPGRSCAFASQRGGNLDSGN